MTEQEDRLSSQAGTVRLDAFTHCLVAKCGPEVRWYTGFSFVYMYVNTAQ